MAKKNLLDDFKNALSIAQAGIKGTLKSLKKTQSKAKKSTPKKMSSPGIDKKPHRAKNKTKTEARRSRKPSKTRNRKSSS